MIDENYTFLFEYLSQYYLGLTFITDWEKRINNLMQYSMKHDIYVATALRKSNGKNKI
jgi:hypothetical protein